jgi:hypothetical protein
MRAGREKAIVLHGGAPAFSGSSKRTSELAAEQSSVRKVFLLSPADAGGARARLLLSATSEFELAVRLRNGGAPLGEVFAFTSSLYFRGKLAYAKRFAMPPASAPGVLVITTSRGLLRPETVVGAAELEEMTRGEVHHENESYLAPLVRDARHLHQQLDASAQVVLLGSIATPKYVKPLLEIFGERLVFPAEFLGIGDMSRGGLLLKCCREGVELKYAQILGAKLSSMGAKREKVKSRSTRRNAS